MAQDEMMLHCSWNGKSTVISIPFPETLQSCMDYLSQRLDKTVLELRYWDDDDEIIQLNEDSDVRAMLSHYQFMQDCPQTAGALELQLRVGPPANLRIDVDVPAVGAGNASSNSAPCFGLQFQRSSAQAEALQIVEQDLEIGIALGHGSGGTVYLSKHRPSNCIMAVKIIPLAATSDMQKQILSELEILHRCHSEYIIKYYGSVLNENRIMICTEYMDGCALDGLGRIAEDILGRIAVAVLRALLYLECSRIMHRDIKPSNILFNSKGEIKICDFGVSTQLQKSMTATYVGTNAYMAPERIQGKRYSENAEVWSLGLTLVELALGRFPYSGGAVLSPFELLGYIVNEPPPRLSSTHFSREFCDLTARCLAKLAEERPTCRQLMNHEFVKHYESVMMLDDVVFREWAAGIIHQRSLRAAAPPLTSPAPGSFPQRMWHNGL
eukprot:m.407344 g.407344  ORF g.407344 m.407344 type:complete len:439 (+) comp21224_c0_seq2:360-1676(+)